jgi:ATP-binding cassette subfamily B protein
MPEADRSATLRRMLALARPEWRSIAVGTLFLALGSAMGLLYPQGLRVILDSVLGGRDPHAVDRAAVLMLSAAAIQAGAVALRAYLFSTAGERVVARLRESLYSSLLSQEIAFFDERRTGELTSRLASDAATLQMAMSANVSMGLRNVAQVIGGVGFLLYTSPLLTGLMLLVVPAGAVTAVTYGRRIRKLSRDYQDALAGAGEVAEEALAGVRTVRSFAAEAAEEKRYSAKVQQSYQLAKTRSRASAMFFAAASFFGFGSAAGVFWYGGRLLLRGSMTVGGLTSFLVYTLMVAFSLGALADLWADFMRALGAAERVFELVDRRPTIPASGGARPSEVRGRVEMRSVGFAYPARRDVKVIDGVDLTLNEGELVALVGPSGAGKSTVAALIGRLYDPDEGAVLLDGRDVRELDPLWLRRRIGAVAQEPILFSTSIADNIRYGRPDATMAEVEAAARAAYVHDFATQFPQGYQTLVGERGVQLSGGQKQRVAIARALLKDPRILVLDEATSALDAESEHLVKQALDRLMRGRTTLVIAHRLSTVLHADRVVVLEGGKIVQSGPHSDLLREGGLYRRLVERQFVAAS